MVAGFSPVIGIVGGVPDIHHGRGDPDGGDAEVVEIVSPKGELDAAEVTAVVAVDVSLLFIDEGGGAAFRVVIVGVAVEKAVGHHEVDDIVLPRAVDRLSGSRGHECE